MDGARRRIVGINFLPMAAGDRRTSRCTAQGRRASIVTDHENPGAFDERDTLPRSLKRATIWLIIGYWFAMFIVDSLFSIALNIDPIASAPYKLYVYAIIGALGYRLAIFLFRRRSENFLPKALWGIAFAAVAAPIAAALDFINGMICLYPQPVNFDPEYTGIVLITSFCQILGWCALHTALLYSFEVRDRERRLAAVREEALEAKMKALRYQISPHFLFNTLNSIAGLIEEGAATHAERMVLSLSTFLRSTLELDPVHDVPLREEIALQREYLGIEGTRFSDRMAVNIAVDEEASAALVPSLILQPLIENAIKHGVGRSTGPVEIAVSATRRDEALEIVVENDVAADDGRPRPPGMGVGLKNVADRLRARFREQGSLSSEITADGRFRAAIALPWRPA